MENKKFDVWMRESLLGYQDYCMEHMDVEENHAFSNRYKKKLNCILWSRSNFGNHIECGIMFRKIAAVVAIIIVLGALSSGVVYAAHKFGWIDGWNFNFIGQTENGEYQFKPDKVEDMTRPQKLVNVEPTYIAKGLIETDRQDKGTMMSGVRWSKNDKQVAEFVRWSVGEDSTFNAKDMPKEVDIINIMGHEMTVYEFEPGERTILWMDKVSEEFEDGQQVELDNLFQFSFDTENVSQKEIKKMIISMYK